MIAVQKIKTACCLTISFPFFSNPNFHSDCFSFFVSAFRPKSLSMDRHCSTLELVKHDETARAPERDYDATAFELDADALAPEVSK